MGPVIQSHIATHLQGTQWPDPRRFLERLVISAGEETVTVGPTQRKMEERGSGIKM